ncbi:hypothetical protein B0A48_08072 [Cryoendolithus antarcticus]|uniref:HTH La-type RNA-binding domain-containing protein n=1 Tax=Cryoendolithus antarcticus TaxID=1507870 RepID=A0A1V8T1K2_9PEZI|nr:hypothetical protein B0A48_08072 [Cryoendolithus antarcticus]
MAGPGVTSPGGFSYAQAAKGRVSAAPSQTASSIVTSGATTPATGVLSDFESGGKTNWADDVEMSVSAVEKLPEAREDAVESVKPVEVKSAVEKAKSEDKAQNSSGVSSPDIAPSASSHDDSSSAQNGSSQSSWELKSEESTDQVTPISAPIEQSGSWIAARAERQSNNVAPPDTTVPKGKKKKAEKAPEPEPPKPVVLIEAAAPAVNPWAKRAQEQKAQASVMQQNVPKPTPTPSAGPLSALKENQLPRTDGRKKAASTAAVPAEPPVNGTDSKPKPTTSNAATQTNGIPSGESKATRADRQSLPNLTTSPPFVKDAMSWPTPDTAPVAEKETKTSAERTVDENDDNSATAGKPRKKPEWKPVPVVPNIVWQTPGVREKNARGGFAGESRGRGGSGVRGRGGTRGGGVAAANGDRPPSRAAQLNGDESIKNASRQTEEDGATRAPRKTERAGSDSSWVEVRKPSIAEMEGFTPEPTNEGKVGVKKVPAPRPQQRQSKRQEASPTDPSNIDTVPEPIPRKPAANGARPEVQDASAGTSINPPIRMVASEPRKDRNGDNGRETNWNGMSRGLKRTGRGRGGGREFANGHHTAHPYNGPASAIESYGVPPSPSSYQTTRNSHRGAYPGSGRGSWHGQNGRAPSLPESGFNKYTYTSPVQPYGFDQNGFNLSPAAYTHMVNFDVLFGVVTMQLDYYFSLDNLLKDTFLRKNMDSQGFVYLDVIAAFNRIKNLTMDKELLKQVCLHSGIVEIRTGEDGKDRLRKAQGWEQWVLPMDERYPSARVDGPSKLERPAQRFPDVYAPPPPSMQYPMTPSRRGERQSTDSANALMNGAARGAFFPGNGFGEMTNGEEVRGRAARSPRNDKVQFPPSFGGQSEDSTSKDVEADVFPDQNLEQLTVCVKVDSRRPPYHSAASRTFSNGSIDTNVTERTNSLDSQVAPTTNGDHQVNGTSATHDNVSATSADSSSPERAATTMSVFWIKDNDNPVGTVPIGLFPEPYVQLRHKALDQRSHAATGTCPYDLDVLYQFWSHFLIRNFNNRLYREFKHYADVDAKERRSVVGMSNLYKYYSQALLSPNQIPTVVLSDYIALAVAEGGKTDGVAVKGLRAAWRNGALNLRNRKKLSDSIGQELMTLLEA